MDISRIRALRGPNLWSRHTCIEAIVACTKAESRIQKLRGFEARLRARFPGIGFLSPLGHTEALPMARVLERAALQLQAQAGCPVSFSHTASTVDSGTYQVVVEYTEEAVGRLALRQAKALIEASMDDSPFDLVAVLAELKELDEDLRLGPSTGAIVDAAVARGIPFRRLTEGSLVQFGWGSRQRRIQAAEIDCSSAISESIAQDKDLTKTLLDAAGVPVPFGRDAINRDDAWAAAMEIGLPVVVKPRDGNQGKGVTVNITSREHLNIAFHAAAEISDDVMIERFIPGHDHRFLVVGDKVIAAARREPPLVIGDGTKTVQELVDEVNSDPRRGDGHATALTRIRFDEIAIARLEVQGLAPDSVPVKGQRVILRNNANLSTGGTATDVTDDVHPELATRVVDAARMVGLDICGIDVVCDTVHLPLEKQGGGIVEVNAAPGLRMHLSPSFGKGRDVGQAVIDYMFAEGETARIPLVAVSGTNGKTTTVRLTAHLLSQQGLRVGMTGTDGVYIDGRRIDTGDCSGPRSARNVLLHPDVDAAVLETARGGVLREGLGFDRCDVAVVTNIGAGDHLGLNYITTVEELAVVKRVIVQNVAENGYAVLNAADPVVAQMAGVCPGSIIFFARDPDNGHIGTHHAQGQRVVTIENDAIVTRSGKIQECYPLRDIPLTRDGSIGFQVENAMAAIASAWALGISPEHIRQGLASFVSDPALAPGRFNLFDYRGATLIADYGHNPDAIRALVDAIEALPAKTRSVVISAAGDRRDEDIRRQTEILGQAFDRVLLYQDACQRGRADGEVIALLRSGLENASRTRHIESIQGEFAAIDSALSQLEPGDLCLILVDQVEDALTHIARHLE